MRCVVGKPAHLLSQGLRRVVPMPGQFRDACGQVPIFLDDQQINITVNFLSLLQNVETGAAAVAVFEQNTGADRDYQKWRLTARSIPA